MAKMVNHGRILWESFFNWCRTFNQSCCDASWERNATLANIQIWKLDQYLLFSVLSCFLTKRIFSLSSLTWPFNGHHDYFIGWDPPLHQLIQLDWRLLLQSLVKTNSPVPNHFQLKKSRFIPMGSYMECNHFIWLPQLPSKKSTYAYKLCYTGQCI